MSKQIVKLKIKNAKHVFRTSAFLTFGIVLNFGFGILKLFKVSGFGFRVSRAIRGFTMVEVVVMLAIIVVVSAIVLVNFPGVAGSINVQRSAQRLALSLRRVQNQALAVRQVRGAGGPVVPPAVGVNVRTAAPTSYILFADMNLNFVYDAGTDIIIETVNLERGVQISELRDEIGGSQSTLNAVFRVPEAQATIYNASASVGQSGLVTFRADASGITQSVRIRTSGQIAIE